MKAIYLQSNNINEDGFIYLSEALKINSTLRFLDLFYNDFNNNSALHFSESLKVNNSLKSIFLCDTQMSDLGLKNFCGGLNQNTYLKHINISWNEISQTGAEFFCNFLKSNHSLKEISIKIGSMNSNILGLLHEALRINSCIEILKTNDLDDDEMGEIQFFLSCNKPWTTQLHSTLLDPFKSCVESLLLVLKFYEKTNRIKIPRFVIFEIIKMIDRKSFSPFSEKFKENKKRKRGEEDQE